MSLIMCKHNLSIFWKLMKKAFKKMKTKKKKKSIKEKKSINPSKYLDKTSMKLGMNLINLTTPSCRKSGKVLLAMYIEECVGRLDS